MVKLLFLALSLQSLTLKLHVGEYAPPPGKEVVGDILYLHGFADAFQNHLPLFREWTRAGFRVVAFDLPGHGRTTGEGRLGTIDAFGVDDLAAIAALVEARTRVDRDRPLLIAGWSTGGLIAARMVEGKHLALLGRRPSGMILFAPGIPVLPFIGTKSPRYPFGEVTLETLTHRTDREGLLPIQPRSPSDVPLFALNLLKTSYETQHAPFPVWLPTLTLAAGAREDKYVSTSGVKRWAKAQGGRMVGVECPRSRHWLDNELPENGGKEVLELARTFAASVIRANGGFQIADAETKRVCRRFK